MLRQPATHPLPPAPKARRLQAPTHHLDHLGLWKTRLLFNLIKSRAILPSHPDNLISKGVAHFHISSVGSNTKNATHKDPPLNHLPGYPLGIIK